MPCSRRFGFEGDDAAYIWYLEDRIFELETSLHRLSRQDARIETLHPLRGQDNFVSNRGKDFAGARYHRSGDSGTFDGQGRGDRTQPELEASPSRGDEDHNHEAEDADNDRTGLKIIEYNPLSKDSKRAGPSLNQGGGQQLRVKSEFASFLADLPSLKDWTSPIDEARRKIILRELVRDCRSAASTCISSNDQSEAQSCTSAEPVNIIPILHQYAHFTARDSSLDRKIAYFRELVFVSSCAVALRIHKEKDQVYEVMRAFRGSNAQSKHLSKLVCGAKWANRAISLLSQTKWASRSWSVIFAAERPVTFYGRFAEYSTETEGLLLKRIRDIVNDSSGHGITDEAAPLVIPLILERLFKDTTSLKVICECLGYSWTDVNSYRPLFNEALKPYDNKRPSTSEQPRHSKRRCQGQHNKPDCDDNTLRPRTQHLIQRSGKNRGIQQNSEQNNAIFDEATSLSPRTPQSHRSLSSDLQASLASSSHTSPRANSTFSALAAPSLARGFPQDVFNDLPNPSCPADPFPASDFPHGIFRDLPNLPESGQPSYLADPFPASDFPHGIFRDLPNLPESGQPSYLADPFPASDFPQDVFNDLPNHSFPADPFPASDFPHGIFRDLPSLPESGQPSYLADPFPASDFPQDVFNDLPNPPFPAEPFPASDFPHGSFRGLPNLPQSSQPSYIADTSPASDFPHESFNALPAGSLPAEDSHDMPKGCSVNFAVTGEPGKCSTDSVATPGSCQGNLADFMSPSSHLPNLTSSVA
ncbi:unnamed protein product [Penicillium nalgiovense]|nr:unnamed protein product [Penicillium nalgiovense]CAG8089481.1 unnamed protein product [Penicillium nalgiovense]CAG8123245.1 unnamed protein product [Penicillium nalgiovense]CAG8131092.1 unnamed protein product [Penicillium nalgiovense]CAG8131499.1 unnamed protein product [Penicillium nalgiovense]